MPILLNEKNKEYNLNYLYDSIKKVFLVLTDDEKFCLTMDSCLLSIALLESLKQVNNTIFISDTLERICDFKDELNKKNVLIIKDIEKEIVGKDNNIKKDFYKKLLEKNTFAIKRKTKTKEYGIIFKLKFSPKKNFIELKTYYFFKVCKAKK